jgi:hypothetical protein
MKAKPNRYETAPETKGGTTLAPQIEIIRSGHAFASSLHQRRIVHSRLIVFSPFLRIIRSANHRYVQSAQDARRNCSATMRKTKRRQQCERQFSPSSARR